MNVVSDIPDRAGVEQPSAAEAERGTLSRLRARWLRSEGLVYPPRGGWPRSLSRVRTGGFVILAIEAILLCWWSSVLVGRFALTKDFGAYQQAAYLIGHGHLNPYSTVLKLQFWRNDTELLIWPLAVFVRIWPHLTALPWLQDLALVGAQGVAFNWMCDIAAARALRERETKISVALAVVGLVLLVGNPWTAWTVAFDVHLEPFVTLFTLCAARDIYAGRRRVWCWVVLSLMCGSVGASYMLGVGVSAALVGRRWSRQGGAVAAVGALWVVFLQAIHGAEATGVLEYNYLYTGHWGGKLAHHLSGSNIAVKAIEHPWRLAEALWRNKINIWANIAPGGAIGLLWLPLLLPCVLVAAEGGLSTPLFSRPGFQSIALGAFVALGSVALLAAFPVAHSKRRNRALVVAMVLLSLNVVAWSVVWLPDVSRSWLLVDKGTANVLQRVRAEMRPNDEVLASQGVVGGFADRPDDYVLEPDSMTVPVHSRTIWIIVTPKEGIEPNGVHGFYSEMQQFSRNPRIHLVTASHGVWAYRFTPAAGQRQFKIRFKAQTSQPAWVLAGAAAKQVTSGPTRDWYVVSTAQPGYLLDESYWREPRGTYRASAAISVSGTVYFEIWNDDTGTLLTRQAITNTHGVKRVSVVARLANPTPVGESSGWGIWATTPVEPVGDSLEIRIWSPGGKTRARLYNVALQAVSQ
jgi:hypothetical protein